MPEDKRFYFLIQIVMTQTDKVTIRWVS